MAEYIERETLLNSICNKHCNCDYDGECPNCRLTEHIVASPAADVAPVVRCNDCKYWQDNNDGYPHEECRWWHGETPDANDFCSYGERITDEQ